MYRDIFLVGGNLMILELVNGIALKISSIQIITERVIVTIRLLIHMVFQRHI